MCNKCHKPKCCCPPAPCLDCVEPEVVVVRKGTKRNICNDLADGLKSIVLNSKPACRLQFAPPYVYLDTVTLSATNYNGPLEYSQDGNLWQSASIFRSQTNGKKKYFIREVGNNACIAAGYATVSNGACTPNWQNVIPLQQDCLAGKINYRQYDGCGNYRWSPTNTSCTECTPSWINTTDPPSTSCIAGTVQIRQSDGCGNFRWLDTEEECDGCVIPTGNATINIPATCTGGNINADGQFIITGIENGDRYGHALDGFYTGPPYSGATNIIDDEIHQTGLQGYDHVTYRTIRIFNGSNSCYVDRVFPFPASICCPSPSFLLSKVDPACSGSTALSNGKLIISALSNATRYQICQNTVFICTPNYAAATPIVGGGPIEILTNVGFSVGQQYKDFAVRVYNGSESCYTDHTLRFNNPCYGQCTYPSYQNAVIVSASCAPGDVPNNNASVILSGVLNWNKTNFSVGSFYSGPNYASTDDGYSPSTTISYELPGNNNDVEYTIRLFNGNDSCVTDITFVMPGSNCDDECEAPSFSLAFTPPTCTNGEADNNGILTIPTHADATKYQVCYDSSFSCTPNYGSAIAIVGSGAIVVSSSIGFSPSEQYRDISVRLYNGEVGCFKTETIRVTNPCFENTECVHPAFTNSYGVAATCAGSLPNNDAAIYVTGVSSANKYGYSAGGSYSGPNYASATSLGGTTISATGLSGNENATQYTVRIFNGSNICFVDIVINVAGSACNEGPECCSLSINSVTLTN